MKLTDIHESLEIAVRSLAAKASGSHFDTDLGRYYMAGAAHSVMPTKDRARLEELGWSWDGRYGCWVRAF